MGKLVAGVSHTRGLFIEMFLTAQLVLAVLILAVEKHKSTFLAPVGIGLALFVIHMAGVPYDGCSVNPARSLGPQVVSGFQGYDWIFYVGPLLGSLLAVGLYKLLKVLVYETANPGQDFDELETAMFIRDPNARTRSRSFDHQLRGGAILTNMALCTHQTLKKRGALMAACE